MNGIFSSWKCEIAVNQMTRRRNIVFRSACYSTNDQDYFLSSTKHSFQILVQFIWLKRFFTNHISFHEFHQQEGSIGHDVVIKPVPYGLLNNERPETGAHHIIYKRKVDESDQFSDFGEYPSLSFAWSLSFERLSRSLGIQLKSVWPVRKRFLAKWIVKLNWINWLQLLWNRIVCKNVIVKSAHQHSPKRFYNDQNDPFRT